MRELDHYRNCPWCKKLHDDGVLVKAKDESGMVFVCHDCAEDYFEKTAAPIFKRGEVVRFSTNNGERLGEIWIVDFGGAIGINEHSYDIFVKEENMLYKHVRESEVLGKFPI